MTILIHFVVKYYCVLYFVLFIVVLMCTFFLCKSQRISQSKVSSEAR